MIPGEVTLTTAPLVDTRVARFNRAPDGQLRIALVDTATGLEFGSFVLTERTVQAVERATAAVRAVRDKLAQDATRADERADPAEDKELYAYLGRVHECQGRKQQIKARAAQSCAEGRYDRAAVLRDVETTLVAPCAQSLRAQATFTGRNPPTHNAATLASVAESFVRRIESELFEEERRKCVPAPVLAQGAAAPQLPPTAPRADAVAPYEVDTLDIHITNTFGCHEKMQRVKASAARNCAEGRYDRAVVLREVEKLLIAPCAQGLRAQSKRDDWSVPTHNAATLAAVAERFVRRIEEELFEQEGRKCAAPPVADPHEVTYLFDVISSERDLYETRLKIEEAMSRGLDRAGALRRITAEIVSLGAIRVRRFMREEGEAAPAFNIAVREEVAKHVLASAEESLGWRTSRGLNAPSATYASTPASQASPAAPRAAAPRAAVTQVSVPMPAARSEAPPAPRGKVRVKALADDVMEVLRASRVDGNAVHLPPTQLDPKLYKRVAEALESVGAKWDRRARAHVFAKGDARDAFVAMLDAGRMTIEKGLSYFPTPAMLAARVAGLAGAGPGRRILEPSAGEGAIVAALLSLGAEVVAVEYDASRAATLRARFPGITIVQGDFLAMRPAELGLFDGVAMNPPFSLAGQPQADIDHVMHAATFAHRGGLVAAIVSQGVEFRDDKKSQAFRAFVAKHGGAIETLPQQSFRETGTDVGSSLVTFVSPGVK